MTTPGASPDAVHRPSLSPHRVRSVPAVLFLCAILLGATGLAAALPASSTPHPAAALPSPPLDRAPSPRVPIPPGVTPRPAGDSARVLETISTLNGTARAGAQEYSGGYYADNLTTIGDRIFVAGEFGETEVVLNASTGAIVSAPDLGGAPIATAYDPVDAEAYVLLESPFELVELSPTDGAPITTFPLGGSGLPNAYGAGLAFDTVSDQFIVTLEPAGVTSVPGDVLFVNPGTGAVTGPLLVGASPTEVAIDPVSQDAFVVDSMSANVTVVNMATHTVVANVSVPVAPNAVEYSSETGDMYIAGGSGELTILNGSTHALVTTLTPGGLLGGETLVPGTALLAFTNSGNWITELYLNNNSVAATLVVAPGMTFAIPFEGVETLAYTTSGHRFYLATDPNDIDAVNASSGAVLTDTSLGNQPYGAAVDPVNEMLYVADSLANNITVVNLRTYQVAATIDLPRGTSPWAVVYDNTSNLVFVANENGSTTVIDPVTDQPIANIDSGAQAYGAVYDAANNRVYILNIEGDSVAALSGATGAVLATIPLPSSGGYGLPEAEALDPLTGTLYVDDVVYNASEVTYASEVVPINTSSNDLGAPVASVPGNAVSMNFDPSDGDFLLDVYPPVTSGTGLPALEVVDPATGAVVDSLTDFLMYGPVAWLPSSGLLAVPDYLHDVLDLFSGASPGTLVGSLALGEGPATSTLDPSTGLVYVVNNLGSSVSVVQTTVTPDEIALATDPSQCGALEFDGAPARGTLSVSSGTYPVDAPSCFGYSFGGWSESGAVATVSQSGTMASVLLTGNATLTAVYTFIPGTEFGIGFLVQPSSCGAVVSVAGASYGSLSEADLAPGNYSLTVSGCAGYQFADWQTAGGASLVATGPLGGTLGVVTNGTVSVVFVSSPGSPATGSSSTGGYSLVTVVAVALAGVLGGALVAVLVVRRPPPPSPMNPPTPPGPSPPAQ